MQALLQNGHQVAFHDLYLESFDPILCFAEIAKDAPLDDMISVYCQELAMAEGIKVIHPNWWGMPPAILKGWVDRVIRPRLAYEFLEGDSGEGEPRGRLLAGRAIVFNASNTLPEREQNAFGDPLQTIWKNCIFGLCGIADFHLVAQVGPILQGGEELGTPGKVFMLINPSIDYDF